MWWCYYLRQTSQLYSHWWSNCLAHLNDNVIDVERVNVATTKSFGIVSGLLGNIFYQTL